MEKNFNELRKELDLLTPGEILCYQDIIFDIDRDILNMMIENDRIDLEANYHKELLNKAKSKLNLTKEASRAVEGFYDVYFANAFLISQNTEQSINLVELFDLTMFELQETVTKEVEEWAKENNIRVIHSKSI